VSEREIVQIAEHLKRRSHERLSCDSRIESLSHLDGVGGFSEVLSHAVVMAPSRRPSPEAAEVSHAEAQEEDDAISPEDVSGEDIEETDEGDYSGDASA